MIVKRHLSPTRVLAYTRGPMLWTLAWAAGASGAVVIWGAEPVAIPFAPVGALGAALAIFVAFRNNTAFARWNEARVAWQNLQIACRSLSRQIAAATNNAVASGTVDADVAAATTRELIERLMAIVNAIAMQVSLRLAAEQSTPVGSPDEWRAAQDSPSPAQVLLVQQSISIKAAIRSGALGQFDPISIEPQMGALATAHGLCPHVRRPHALRPPQPAPGQSMARRPTVSSARRRVHPHGGDGSGQRRTVRRIGHGRRRRNHQPRHPARHECSARRPHPAVAAIGEWLRLVSHGSAPPGNPSANGQLSWRISVCGGLASGNRNECPLAEG